MKLPFWRCATILLLLWALPAQWVVAATAVPCAGHTMAAVRAESASTPAPMHRAAPQRLQAHGGQNAAHHDGPTAGHTHDLFAVAHHDLAADLAPDGASAHPQAKCGGTGHCCLSAALLATTLADFAQRPVSMDFAPATQHHRAPVLGGPDRPPQVRAA